MNARDAVARMEGQEDGEDAPAAGQAVGAKRVNKKVRSATKKKIEQAKRERTTEGKAALQQRSNELLARPLSAFMLFGFSQRGILKKQKSTAVVRDVVKAVGERAAPIPGQEYALAHICLARSPAQANAGCCSAMKIAQSTKPWPTRTQSAVCAQPKLPTMPLHETTTMLLLNLTTMPQSLQ